MRLDAHDKVLIALSIICGTRGVLYGLLPPNPNLITDKVSGWMPLWVYGALWLTAAMAGVIDAFRHKQGRWSMAAQATLCVFWGLCYLVADNPLAALFFISIGSAMRYMPKLIAVDTVGKP